MPEKNAPGKRLSLNLLFAILALATLAAFSLCAVHYGRIGARNSERAAKRIMASCADYSVRKTRSSTVYFTEADEQFARAAESMILTYLPLLQADFGHSGELSATVVIYPSADEMYTAIGYRQPERSGDKALEPLGAYTSGILTLLSPSLTTDGSAADSSALDSFIEAGPLVHELSHFVFDMKAKGNYPEWLSEGAALYCENKYTGYLWRGVSNQPKATYNELARGFKYMNENESYRKSYEIVKFIAESKGESALRNIYTRLEKGQSAESALKRELGKAFNELDGL